MKRLALCLLGAACFARPAAAQSGATAYTVDLDRSMVWWQIDPHFGHLWASSCPKDPSWQPGEGHSAGYYINYATRPKGAGVTTHRSETKIPLFPRKTVRPNCRRAVKGQFTTSDAATFANVKGYILVSPDSIETGADHRNVFANHYVFDVGAYPTIRFAVDSLSNVVMNGDSMTAVAVGTFEFKGVGKPTRVQINGVKDASGLRIRGMWAMPATDLRDRFNVSQTALGAGVGLKLWDTLFMGFDVILTPPNSP